MNRIPSRIAATPDGPASADRVLECGQLRLRFQWQDDRFAHAISLVDAAHAGELLRSVEGVADEAWPAGPPLQSLHLEQQPGGRHVALLLGMAGKSHWSVAVELFPDRSCLRWDVACRVRGGAYGKLGSRYLAAAKVHLIDEGRALICGSEPRGGLIVRLDAAEPWSSESSQRLLASDSDHVEIVAESRPASDSATTVRWSYVIEPAGS
ncbi:MAG: hypothetical protein WD845_10630 [Pirellulales bacterium]